jgi:hypothetical protein
MDTKHPPSLRDLYPNRLVHKYIYARIEINLRIQKRGETLKLLPFIITIL